jgi:hypothetical protein
VTLSGSCLCGAIACEIVLAPPEVMPWGGVLAHLRDPDGNVLTLVGRPRAGS